MIRIWKWTPFYWFKKLWDMTIEAKAQDLAWLGLGPYWSEILNGEIDSADAWKSRDYLNKKYGLDIKKPGDPQLR